MFQSSSYRFLATQGFDFNRTLRYGLVTPPPHNKIIFIIRRTRSCNRIRLPIGRVLGRSTPHTSLNPYYLAQHCRLRSSLGRVQRRGTQSVRRRRQPITSSCTDPKKKQKQLNNLKQPVRGVRFYWVTQVLRGEGQEQTHRPQHEEAEELEARGIQIVGTIINRLQCGHIGHNSIKETVATYIYYRRVLGHNPCIDLCLLYHNFIKDLPSDFSTYASSVLQLHINFHSHQINKYFSNILDTKVVANHYRPYFKKLHNHIEGFYKDCFQNTNTLKAYNNIKIDENRIDNIQYIKCK